MSVFQPKVSIVIPVYNGSDYLAEAIDSALAQTYRNIEIIVIDDGSTDDGATRRIATGYGDKIKYVHKSNGGVASALNRGINEMTGEYFSWLSHDDLYSPHKIRTQISALRKGRSPKAVVANGVAYFGEGGIIERTSPKRDGHVSKHPLSYLLRGYINGCALLIHRDVLVRHGGFNEDLPTTQDFDLWFRILRESDLIYIERQLTFSRSHANQGSKALLNEHVSECDDLWIRMMTQLDDSEKSAIFGSPFDFYHNVHDFLSHKSAYEAATLMARRLMLESYGKHLPEEGAAVVTAPELLISPQAFIDFNSKRIPSKPTIFFPLAGDFDDRGGLNRAVTALANKLSPDFNIVVSYTGCYSRGYPLDERITHFQMTIDETYPTACANTALLLNCDAVIFSHNCQLVSLNALEACNSANIRTIAFSHEDYFAAFRQTDFYEIWPIRNSRFALADAVVWLTAASCKVYALANDNGLVIPNFSQFDRQTRPTDLDLKITNNLVAVARWNDSRKRIELLLSVFERITASNPEITLTIVGILDPSMIYKGHESIGEAIDRINGSRQRITTTGEVLDPDTYYSMADLNILPSHHEGFGLTIIEAAAFGVPSVVFNNSGFSELIDDGVTGIVCPEADCDAMAKRILELYENVDLLAGMKRASAGMIDEYGPHAIVPRWRKLIEDVISGNEICFPRYTLTHEEMKTVSAELHECLRGAAVEIHNRSSRMSLLARTLKALHLLGVARSVKRFIFGIPADVQSQETMKP